MINNLTRTPLLPCNAHAMEVNNWLDLETLVPSLISIGPYECDFAMLDEIKKISIKYKKEITIKKNLEFSCFWLWWLQIFTLFYD